MERPELTGPHALSHKTSEKTHAAVRLAARGHFQNKEPFVSNYAVRWALYGIKALERRLPVTQRLGTNSQRTTETQKVLTSLA
ncbi:hypothetical protein DPX16_7392 [Anabarilius grahami]|uniref:Uncharacterized protein n=1 Tax=Anabarilius grahami TaxID=495550 RepID=A0A3N0Z297_ANAGA|nr:hypothetical protein DPX16_7392 [Anabarilius grahami]